MFSLINLSENIARYLDFCEDMKGLSEKSVKAYTNDLSQFNIWNVGKCDWSSKQVLEEYIKHLYKAYKPRTAKRKIASLKAFFHYLELEEIIDSSPFHKINFKRREAIILPKSIPVTTVTEMFNIVYHIASNTNTTEFKRKNAIRDIAVLELLFASGIRVGELCSLRCDDIDLKNKIMRVNGKGAKERYIHITNKNVVNALKQYRKLYASEISKTGYFFCNNRQNRLSEQSVRFMVNKYANLCTTSIHITPHMFRHTVATLLLEEDVDIRYIQELLGHSSITTTQIYTHISLSAQKRILTKKHPRNKIHINK